MSALVKRLRCAFAVTLALAAAPAFAQTSASDFTSAVRYDAMRRSTGTIAPDPDGVGSIHYAATRTTYDSAGRPIRVERGELAAWQSEAVKPEDWTGFTRFSKVETGYDALDRKALETVFGWDPGTSAWVAASATQYSYDGAGRLECTAIRMNPAIYGSLPASACTLGTAGSNGPDRITRTVYDAAGQVRTIQKAYGITIANGFPATLQQDYQRFTYDLDGKPVSMTDANGQTASMRYDGHERQDRWNFPEKTLGGTPSATDYEAYSYDAGGNRLSLRKRDGSVINYSYDALNRVTVKDIPGGTSADVYYGYDLRGLQLYARFVSASGLGITNVYDGLGRLTSATNDMGTVSRTLSYEWDADGNRTRITHPDSTVPAPRYFTYEYDGLDRPVAIKENGSTAIVTDTYDNQGRRLAETRGAVTTAYSYDPVSRLASLSDDLAGTASDVTSTFAYNPVSQLLHKTRSNDLYGFGGYPNPATPINRAYTTNGLNQYTGAGSATFSYDANGNLTGNVTSAGTITYTYDAENRMLTASGPTATTLKYDPLGRLWRVVLSNGTIEFTYDGDALVYYTSGATGVNRYVHGNSEDDPLIRYATSDFSSRTSLQADAQGSIVSMVYADGTPQFINSYDEYGIPGQGNGGIFQYTGQVYLPWIGLHYYKARMYSPTLGRFLQTDPIGYEDQNNLYAYVGNEPIGGRDPTGQYDCRPSGSLCKVVDQGVKNLKVFADSRLISRAERRRINSIIRAVGSRDDHNGVVFQFGQLPGSQIGNAEPLGGGKGTITLDQYELADILKEHGGRAYILQVEQTIAHEVQHIIDGRMEGLDNSIITETNAYQMESIIGVSLGEAPWNARKIQQGVFRSCRDSGYGPNSCAAASQRLHPEAYK